MKLSVIPASPFESSFVSMDVFNPVPFLKTLLTDLCCPTITNPIVKTDIFRSDLQISMCRTSPFFVLALFIDFIKTAATRAAVLSSVSRHLDDRDQ